MSLIKPGQQSLIDLGTEEDLVKFIHAQDMLPRANVMTCLPLWIYHPLDPLSTEEYTRIKNIVTADIRERVLALQPVRLKIHRPQIVAPTLQRK